MKNYIVLILCLFILENTMLAQTPAFPGAEGAGMYTTGGRGGNVYFVTKLEDNNEGNKNSSEGSLRWCLNQKGVRTILFKVSGTIFLKSALQVTEGDVTIAGQSAPGDGICLAHFPVTLAADNIIVRYMRFRMGDDALPPEKAHTGDAFSGGKMKNIIIDHCSISWSTDECSSFYDNENFTMQWCIISESLRLSTHAKGPHGYGAIWGGVHASYHHNLMAHHDSRFPRFGPGKKHAGHDSTDVRNNVFYNWNGNGAYGGEAMHINIVNNYYKPGPATEKRMEDRVVALNAHTGLNGFESIKGIWGKYYIDGNLLPHNSQVSAHNWRGVSIKEDVDEASVRLNQPVFIRGTINTHKPQDAYEKVLQYAGCALRRDAVDRRIIDEVKNGTAAFKGKSKYNGEGGIWKSINYPRQGLIDSQNDLNPNPADKNWSAWPILKTGKPIVDKNKDGIADQWLAKYHKGKMANDKNEAGYTYLELYLNSLVEDITNGQR